MADVAGSISRASLRLSIAESAKRKASDPEGGERRAREWAERNADAIRAYNPYVEEKGVFGDLRP